MNILVTGGTGFLGKKTAYRLKELGHNVSIIGRNEIVGKKMESEGIAFIKCDLSDRTSVLNSCENMDYVFHCGAFSSPWGKYEDFYSSNVTGTKNVIEGCFTHKIKRLIHVSTPSIYFQFDERLDVKEDSSLPKHFVNHYAHTKYLAEIEIDKAFEKGLPVITIRPRAIFGPEDNAIIPRLIKVNHEKFIPLIKNGEVVIDLTYVENVVDALLLCMESPENTLGQKYNITNDERVRLFDILTILFKEIEQPFKYRKINYSFAFQLARFLEWFSNTFRNGKEPLLTQYTVSVLSNSQTLCIEKAKNELGYIPRFTVQDGINEFVKWWKGEAEHD